VTGSFFVPHDLDTPVRGAATGPLAGLTAVVKDMYDITGSRTGGGNPDWLAAQRPAARHAAAVEQILAAGATITAKTICDEFFYSVAGVNAHYGTPANLRAPGRLPGFERVGGGVRRKCLRFRAWQRHGRVGAHPGLVQRPLRPAPHPRPRRHHWRDGDGADVRCRWLVL
jgi:Amidase